MDAETIFESLVAVIRSQSYSGAAKHVFKDELFSCDQLSDSEMAQVFDVLELNFDSEEDAIKAAKEIAPLLAKCPGFGEFITKKLVDD